METRSCWKPALDASFREQVFALIPVIANRLSSPEQVMAVTRHQEPIFWTETAFAAGLPGLALLFFWLARSTRNATWLDVAHTYLTLAATATRTHPLDSPGLARGSSGFAVVLSCAGIEDRYQEMRQQLEQKLARQILHTVWWKPVSGAEVFQYDAIAGASGMVASLCCHQEHDPLVRQALFLLLHYLVHFVESADQAWSVPASLLDGHRPDEGAAALVNCGLAHGVPGPLAALAIARRAGYQIPGQAEAIRRLAYWLADHHLEAAWGMDWPCAIPVGLSLAEVRRLAPARSGWCYGAPGLLRALWLAATSLEDARLQERALQGIEALLRRPVASRHIDPLTLCHGAAGLLLICLRFLHETDHPHLREYIAALVQQIIAHFQPDLPFGFRYPFKAGTLVDSVGLLIGVSGTLLALLAACTEVEPSWDRALLLS